MKKIIQALCVCALVFLMPIQTMAQTVNWNVKNNVPEMTTTQVVSSDQISRVLGSARGRLLSSATVQISDEGDGVLGVYANTLCHTDMKDIYMTIYLEMWDEEAGDWMQLNAYDYEWHTTSPDETLSMTVVAFDIVGLERRREYRLRSMHAARSHANITEMMSSRTGGIILR